MKTVKLSFLLAAMLLASPLTHANNIIRMKAPVEAGKAGEPSGNWLPWESVTSEWVNAGSLVNCSNWSPLAETIDLGTAFKQTATDCQQPQERIVQATEKNEKTLVVRNVGEPIIETRSIEATSTRDSLGTKAFTNAQYVVSVIQLDTQWGYMPNAAVGELISSNDPDHVLNYVTLGYGGRVLVGFEGRNQNVAALFESIKIDMVDAAGNIFYTISSSNIVNDYPYSPFYVGWNHSATDYANAKLAKRYIVTVEFKK
ncbi:hypothetical protein RBE51_21110 [Pseudomonas taiwanensis]|uniref:hypothetical protein n=1 Tax=Pseudomonas taiwanensis TaxID=470150 RepID=UPI0028DE23FC|nr:hypothetical protein [Pseudomonas taiwanensis]MDT8925297.1 hypothetical protein [Pseudomonas taiwanensis]